MIAVRGELKESIVGWPGNTNSGQNDLYRDQE